MANKKKNKSHKKKRIAKHILEARQRQTTTSDPEAAGVGVVEGETSITPASTLSSSHPDTAIQQLQKYIQLGQQYLSEWDQNQKRKRVMGDTSLSSSSAVDIWKFHKNTQTWLLRNMYDADRVPKASFQILMEYLEGLKGGVTREWVNKDAIRRVLRYKEWEKILGNEQQVNEGGKKKESGEKMDQDTKKEKDDAALSGNNDVDDEERFKSLSGHDKRKEYKRARKVLEVMKKMQELSNNDNVNSIKT